MESLKREAMNAIAKLPEDATVDEIMYRLYVIDKVRKGQEAAARGETIAIEDLKKEIQSW
jgi:predicted transcriptional regulator